jgi:gluconolactonase
MAKNGKVSVIEKSLHRPNGVALSPDESTLYVTQSDPARPVVMSYSLDKAGNVTGSKLFHDFTDLVAAGSPGLPDGLTVAADGTIFTTGPGGVIVLSKEGKRLGRISNGKATANCKFGEDGKTLFLTSHDTLARVRLNIAGY